MIKLDASNKYYSTLDPAASFTTHQGAATHEAYQRIVKEASRPDSRDDIQKMTDSAWTVPREKALSPLDKVEASLRKKTGDPAYRLGLSAEESALLHLKSLRREQEADADNAADAAEWAERHIASMIEATRLLQEAENDFTTDRAVLVKAEQLVKALNTVGSDEGWIRSQLHSLQGTEEAKKLAIREAAGAALADAKAKYDAVAVAQTVTVRVPVEGDDLLSRGNSYTSNLLASGAPPEQLAAAFDAMDKAFAGDTAALEATLAANGEVTNAG